MPKKETQNSGQEPEKIVTKYDLKMQRRKELKEKEAREDRISRIVGIVVVAALVCLVASFPIRNYLTLNGTHIKINGEPVTRVEFDYYYHLAVNSYINQYGPYLSYFGLDVNRDLASQMYSETLTWKDYFEEQTVESLKKSKGLVREAESAGFSYDTTEDYRVYMENMENAATETGTTMKQYVKDFFGAYATEARLKPYIEESLLADAYVQHLSEEKTPSQEQIEEYYDGHQEDFDSVDYRVSTVNAELPTEPTELADPAEESSEGEEGTEGESGTEAAYDPSEAEIAAAMEKAKAEADKLAASVMTDGEMHENTRKSSVTYLLTDWLFAEERKAGDTTVIEDTNGHRYYVVGFEKRYRDEKPTAAIRVTVTTEDNGQAILDEWKAGEATEESFAAICDKYNNPEITSLKGGLLENAVPSSQPEALGAWLEDPARKEGDTAVISQEGEEYTYVVYYVKPGEARWILEIRNTLLTESLTEVVTNIMDAQTMEDPNNNLAYVKIRAQEAAASESSAQESGSGEASDGSDQGSSDEASGQDSDGGQEETSGGASDGDGEASGEGQESPSEEPQG